MALVGYARVSSAGQSLTVQLDKLVQCHSFISLQWVHVDRRLLIITSC